MTDSSATSRSIRSGIEKISLSAPKRVRFLKERLDRIELFRSDLNCAEEFCREAETFLEEAKSRNDAASKQVFSSTQMFLLQLTKLLPSTSIPSVVNLFFKLSN